jgi:hypothetical protein
VDETRRAGGVSGGSTPMSGDCTPPGVLSSPPTSRRRGDVSPQGVFHAGEMAALQQENARLLALVETQQRQLSVVSVGGMSSPRSGGSSGSSELHSPGSSGLPMNFCDLSNWI